MYDVRIVEYFCHEYLLSLREDFLQASVEFTEMLSPSSHKL